MRVKLILLTVSLIVIVLTTGYCCATVIISDLDVFTKLFTMLLYVLSITVYFLNIHPAFRKAKLWQLSKELDLQAKEYQREKIRYQELSEKVLTKFQEP